MRAIRLLISFVIVLLSCTDDCIEPTYTQPEGKIRATYLINTNPSNWSYYYYDENELLVKIEKKNEGKIQRLTTYSYTETNKVQYVESFGHNMQFNGYDEYLYNENDRLYRINDYGTNHPGVVSYSLFTYDEAGNIISINKYWEGNSEIISENIFEYDTSRRKWEWFTYWDANGTIFRQYKLEYFYDGDLLVEKRVVESEYYELGAFEKFNYNSQSQMIEKTEILNPAGYGDTRQTITIYEYF